MEPMRILILAYDFPPLNSIGAKRPWSWYRYLPEFGYHPVVVTRQWDESISAKGVVVEGDGRSTIIRVPYRSNLRDRMLARFGEQRFSLLRRMLTAYYSIAQYFTFVGDNRAGIYHAAAEHLQKHPCHAIIATGEPFVLFRYAKKLSERFNIPWVADYRDGWSTNWGVWETGGRLEQGIYHNIIRHVERSVTPSAKLVTVAAPALTPDIRSVIGEHHYETIFNGYFPELFEHIAPAERTDNVFRIAYSGTLYGYQRLDVFLDGLKLFMNERRLTSADVKVTFYGLDIQNDQRSRLLNHDPALHGTLHSAPRIPHETLLQELNASDVMLILTNPARGQLYAKVFDYLALKKEILVTVTEPDIHQLLQQVGEGHFCDTPDEVAATLGTLHAAFKAGTLNQGKEHSAGFLFYSRQHQTQRLAGMLNAL
jgi:glycosyltransferase involved in cell wall biosynthesis